MPAFPVVEILRLVSARESLVVSSLRSSAVVLHVCLHVLRLYSKTIYVLGSSVFATPSRVFEPMKWCD